MIRIEVKVIIPDDYSKEKFFKVFLARVAEDADSFFWQIHYDVLEGERVSLEAVLGPEGFPFLEGKKLLVFRFDLAKAKHADRIRSFFRSLAVSCDIEIDEFRGERIYGDVLDLDEL